VRNLERPATTDMLVLGELNRGANTFEKILKNTGLEREALNSILEELEKKGLMEVVQKKGMLGPKIELQVTEKGFKEFYS
jgi:DNA-binding HxlR family transcriptional regulator